MKGLSIMGDTNYRANPQAPRKSRSGTKITICGVEYKSMYQAAIELNIDCTTLRQRQINGLKDEELIFGDLRRIGFGIKVNEAPYINPMQEIVICGIVYKTIMSAAKTFNVQNKALYAGLLMGLQDEELIEFAKANSYNKKSGNCIEVRIGDEVFPSLTACATKYNIPLQTMMIRYQKGLRGQDLVTPVEYKERKSIVVDGVTYPTIYAASKATGIHYQTLVSRLKAAEKRGVQCKIFVNGVGYKSFEEVCRNFNISSDAVRKRMQKGMSLEEALTAEKHSFRNARRVVYNGEEFETISACCEQYNVKKWRVYEARLNGKSFEEAMDAARKAETKRSVHYDGQTFSSLTACCKHYKVSKETVQKSLNQGNSLQEAMEQAIQKNKSYVYKGRKFKSIAECCRYHNIDPNLVYAETRKGKTLSAAMNKAIANKQKKKKENK